ncbi:MAG: hypothetical protein NTX22_14085 [Ignavibacteriales bacterium]|nr:hypothetical protein [Ignavibacteriales bacterium]
MYIILLLIIVNSAGFLLRYYGLDRFVIVLGFRFHLSLILPFILLLTQKKFGFIFSQLKKFKLKIFLTYFLLSTIPVLIICTVFYLMKVIEFADPDYFYEFGISSIIDLPIYFIWNLPQLLMIGLFLKFISEKKKFSFPLTVLVTLSLFVYELIPLHNDKLVLFSVYQMLTVSLLISLILVKTKNLYSFSLPVFFILWSNVLLFGSDSKTMIQILLAKNYESWEGFFELSKSLINYRLIIQVGITIIVFLIYYIVKRKEKDS